MNRRLILAAAAALWATSRAIALPPEDGLTALEQNPSPSATEQVGKIYHRSKDPYARLWLMDVLYARVRQYHDVGAMELLWEASKDRHPDVRRKAITDLEAFHFLPESRGREIWLARVRKAVQTADKDSSPAVRSAGRELGIAADHWQVEQTSSPPPPQLMASPRYSPRRTMPIFVWAVCFQLLGCGWYGMGMTLLAQSGTSGRAVSKTVEAFKKNISLLAFPALTILLLMALLGASLGWRLIASGMPSSELQGYGAWNSWEALVVAYLASGIACFLPSALMAGKLVGGLKRSSHRIFGFFFLGIIGLALVWPVEAVWRIMRARWPGGPFFWIAKTGTPFAFLLTCALMVQDDLAPWAAVQEAARCFPAAAKEPGVEFWGRAPFQTPFVLWCLASPVLFSLSLLPALELGFHPGQLFNIWFLSDIQFFIGFGWWAGILFSVAGLGELTALGAVRAAQLVREPSTTHA